MATSQLTENVTDHTGTESPDDPGFVLMDAYNDYQQVPFAFRTDLPMLRQYDYATVAIGLKPDENSGPVVVCACTKTTPPQIGILEEDGETIFRVSSTTKFVGLESDDKEVMVLGTVIGLRMSRPTAKEGDAA